MVGSVGVDRRFHAVFGKHYLGAELIVITVTKVRPGIGNVILVQHYYPVIDKELADMVLLVARLALDSLCFKQFPDFRFR